MSESADGSRPRFRGPFSRYNFIEPVRYDGAHDVARLQSAGSGAPSGGGRINAPKAYASPVTADVNWWRSK